jgi:sulfite exporter TauE/SafE
MLVAAFELAGFRTRAPRIVTIGRAPRTPLVARALGHLPREPLLVGAVSALFPCGALYGGLLVASSTGSAALGAGAMSAFAVASGVGLLAATSVASLARSATARRALAMVLVAGAALVVARPIASPEPSSAISVCGHRR